MILVACQDKQMRAQLCEAITRELGLECEQAEFAATSSLDAYRLVLTDRPVDDAGAIIVDTPCYVPDLLVQIDRRLAGMAEKIQLDRCMLCLQSKQLTKRESGAQCDLTDKETELLYQLHLAGDAGMDRGALLERVWGVDKDANTRTLETHIHRLRSKIKTLTGDEMIALQDGTYRLVA